MKSKQLRQLLAITAAFSGMFLTVSRASAVSTWPVVGNANWVQSDIGNVARPGNATFADGMFTITGGGEDIWKTQDSFHFVYHPIMGDGTIVARVVSLGNTNGWAKAGLMIRERIEANSRQAMMIVSSNEGADFQMRTETEKDTSRAPGARYRAPYWVRLDRKGDTITSYNSIDGTKWDQVGTVTMSLPKLVFVGFAVTSHDNTKTTVARFDHIAMSFH